MWLWLFPLALAIHIYDHGFLEGLLRFASFLYVGSFVLLVALLIASLFTRALRAKTEMLITTTIVIFYVVFEAARGNAEALLNGAIFGVIVGSALGISFVFLLSPLAAKVRSAESAMYRRVRGWFNGKSS